MPIGKTSLKSVEQDRDAVREKLSPISWAGGSYISDPQILDNANVVTAAVLVQSSGDTTALEAQITSLQVQLSQAQAALVIAQAQNAADAVTIAALQTQVASLQAQVASLQAQAATDAATISSLQAQVTTLTAQVASLTAQVAVLSNRFPVLFYTNITTIDDNFYVPPSYNDLTVDIGSTGWKLPTALAYNNITTVGGGYP